MAISAAERQRAYRRSRQTAGENGERRINTWVSTGAALAQKTMQPKRAARHRASQTVTSLQPRTNVIPGLCG
jgi:hypothetical protein